MKYDPFLKEAGQNLRRAAKATEMAYKKRPESLSGIRLEKVEDTLVYGASSAATAFIVARLFGIDSSLSTKIAGLSLIGGVVTRAILMDRTANK